jgi:hypothetical protein
MTKDLTFTVKNTGGGTLTGSASTSVPFNITSGGSFSLGAGASQTIIVRFLPTTKGTFSNNISLTSNGGNSSLMATGTGAAGPKLSVTPSSTLDFGNVIVGSSSDKTLTIQNVGDGTLVGSVSSNAQFSVLSGSPFSLSAGSSANFTIRFSPTVAGIFTKTEFITSNGGNRSLKAGGIGYVPALDKAPDIISLTPAEGVSRNVITIQGSNFGQVAASLQIGSTPVNALTWSDTLITFSIPGISPGSYPITVTTANGNTKKNLQILPSAPIISSLSANSGSAGANIVVNGRNFGANQGNSTVAVGRINAQVVSWSDTRVIVTIPPALNVRAAPYPMTITTEPGTASATYRVRDLIMVPQYLQGTSKNRHP